jgi:protein-S-isoprenylcysteine O-methyltransferase Ste14
MLLWVAFGVISAGLVAASWRALRVPGSHGFYRFFGWEAIAALILINSHAWFADTWSIPQILSWFLLSISLLLLIPGAYQFRVDGKASLKQKSSSRKEDATLFPFERTSELVTSGIYRYIRHPLYGSLLFLAWGVMAKEISWGSVILGGIATLFLWLTSKADESECSRYFGVAYGEYMKRSKMFIPFLW